MTAILNNISSFSMAAVRKTWSAIKWTAKKVWSATRFVVRWTCFGIGLVAVYFAQGMLFVAGRI